MVVAQWLVRVGPTPGGSLRQASRPPEGAAPLAQLVRAK